MADMILERTGSTSPSPNFAIGESIFGGGRLSRAAAGANLVESVWHVGEAPVTGKYDVRRDRVLFLDVEMTCWDGPPPEGEEQEIVEFGLAEVDVAELAVVRSGSLYVRPARSRVSSFCESLTGLSGPFLRSRGRPLAEVASTLRKEWGVGSKAWMSWGSDRRAVDRDFAREGIASPFSAAFHDVGFQFGMIAGAERGIGLGRALETLGVERAGREHSGAGDAESAALAWLEVARRMRAELGLGTAPPRP